MQSNKTANKRTQFFEKEDVRNCFLGAVTRASIDVGPALQVSTLFQMFDPTGRGEISVAQYNQALLSCGIEQPTVPLVRACFRGASSRGERL